MIEDVVINTNENCENEGANDEFVVYWYPTKSVSGKPLKGIDCCKESECEEQSKIVYKGTFSECASYMKGYFDRIAYDICSHVVKSSDVYACTNLKCNITSKEVKE